MTAAPLRRILPVALLGLLLAAGVARGGEPCPAEPLQARPATQPNPWTSPEALAELAATKHAEEPEEIMRVRDGVVTDFVGAFVNDGLSGWTAYDAQRQLFVSVRRKLLTETSGMPSPGTGEYLRLIDNGGRRYAEIVRIVAAGTEAMAAVTCAANRAWRAPVPKSGFPRITDALRAGLYVIADRTTRNFQWGDLPQADERALLGPIEAALRAAPSPALQPGR